MLAIAARPADEDHEFGHSKAEYFSSGVEGTLNPAGGGQHRGRVRREALQSAPIEQVGLGLAVSVVASAVNLGVALVLLGAARRHHSITLEATPTICSRTCGRRSACSSA